MISFDDFQKVEMKVGKILSAEKVPETDKLLKLSVDFGLKPASGGSPKAEEPDTRQIISGIAEHFPDCAKLVGKNFLFVTNLEPRVIKGLESNGMIIAVKSGAALSLLKVPNKIKPGSRAS